MNTVFKKIIIHIIGFFTLILGIVFQSQLNMDSNYLLMTESIWKKIHGLKEILLIIFVLSCIIYISFLLLKRSKTLSRVVGSILLLLSFSPLLTISYHTSMFGIEPTKKICFLRNNSKNDQLTPNRLSHNNLNDIPIGYSSDTTLLPTVKFNSISCGIIENIKKLPLENLIALGIYLIIFFFTQILLETVLRMILFTQQRFSKRRKPELINIR